MKGRFAPSPSGRMHIGNVYAALMSWLSTRKQGGRWVLRIEDLDPQRSKPLYSDLIRRDLEWLGLSWDEEYIQSERFHIYAEHLRLLQERKLTYPCYCTRADIMATQAPHESDGRVVYKGTCRQYLGVQPSGPSTTRILVPNEDIQFVDKVYGPQCINLANHCGDFILQRKDGAWAYQLAVVVDDALMGITEVVRGEDLLLSVPQQLYLYRLFGYDAPAFAHIPLLKNEAGQRLSKRDKAVDIGVIRDSGTTPAELIGRIAHIAGLTPTPSPILPDALISDFDFSKLKVRE